MIALLKIVVNLEDVPAAILSELEGGFVFTGSLADVDDQLEEAFIQACKTYVSRYFLPELDSLAFYDEGYNSATDEVTLYLKVLENGA